MGTRLRRFAVSLCVLTIVCAVGPVAPRPLGAALPTSAEAAWLPHGGSGVGQDDDSSRIARLSAIAQALNDPKSDAVALTTEAARLCGFSIWTEDRVRIAAPTGMPALKLAVTDTEIREYTTMFRTGHSVALGDLVGAMDVSFRGLGGQGSVGPYLMTWLHDGGRSENASVRALTAFLQDLGTFRHGAAFASFSGDAERLDAVQALFLLRVLTEDMGVPLRKALAKAKPGSSSEEPLASTNPQPLESDAASCTAATSPGGPLERFEPPQTPCAEMPGWAEDAYMGVVAELFDKVSDLVKAGKAFGKYKDGVDKANALASVVKFIATYTYLEGEIRVEDPPGQPLVRTKDTSPGDTVLTVVARFVINGNRVTDWMKDHRCLVALAGLDLDMPKTGALKGVRTEWYVHQSTIPREQLIQPLDWQGSLYKIMTDENGEARVKFTGNRQPVTLVAKKVMPVEKLVKITVTPQVKATEMKQDLVDAVLGAAGIRSGPAGFLTIIMETLYRMNWTGETTLRLRVRDWQRAESIGRLGIEIKASGHEFRREYALHMSVDRSVEFIDTGMDVFGGDLPAVVDPALLTGLTPLQRSQIEEGAKQQLAMAQKRKFSGTGPGTSQMSVNDQMSLSGSSIGGCDPTPTPYTNSTAWSGSESPSFQRFTVDVDLEKKTATVGVPFVLTVQQVDDRMSGGKNTRQTRKSTMRIFDDLKLQSPVDVTKGIVIPLQETAVIDMDGATNYHGVMPIPFTFGPRGQFKGTAYLSYSVTRKIVKAK